MSLVKKITFFMFVNISLMPYAIFIYGKIDKEIAIKASKEYLALQIFIISIGNLFKPLLTFFSVERVLKSLKIFLEKIKKISKLNQIQAN